MSKSCIADQTLLYVRNILDNLRCPKDKLHISRAKSVEEYKAARYFDMVSYSATPETKRIAEGLARLIRSDPVFMSQFIAPRRLAAAIVYIAGKGEGIIQSDIALAAEVNTAAITRWYTRLLKTFPECDTIWKGLLERRKDF